MSGTGLHRVDHAAQVTIVEAGRRPRVLQAEGISAFWSLAATLAWRDIAVRYRQALLGVAWAVIQPVVTMVVFTFVFGRVARLPSDGVPYELFALAALLPWQLFAAGVDRAGNSLVANASLLTKVFFPRLAMPLAAVLSVGVDFVVGLAVFVGLALYFGVRIGLPFLAVPLLATLAGLAAFAVGTWLSALNVRYRDVRHAIPFLLQVGIYVSPVGYTAAVVPVGPVRWLYALNPMVGVIGGFRAVLLGQVMPWTELAMSAAVISLLLAGGLSYFRRAELAFADVI